MARLGGFHSDGRFLLYSQFRAIKASAGLGRALYACARNVRVYFPFAGLKNRTICNACAYRFDYRIQRRYPRNAVRNALVRVRAWRKSYIHL